MFFAQILEPGRHELNLALSGILIWYAPLLIISAFLVLGPLLQRIRIRNNDLRSIIGVLLLMSGGFVLTGLASMLTLGFGLCYGNECGVQVAIAVGLVPALLSLIVTLPVSVTILNNNSQPIARKASNKYIVTLGLIIFAISSIVYVPRLVSAVVEYRSVKSMNQLNVQ